MSTKIYIDQGHNPQNPNAGSEGNNYREQDLVYDIGVRLANILKNRGFETKLSRKCKDAQLGTSTLTSLQARVNEANDWNADYFISLHTNAAVNSSASGTEALVFSLPSKAASLAFYILEQLFLITGLRTRGVIPRPNLYVLKKTKMPSLIVELGFITNSGDANLMHKNPELFALGIANGISEYLSDVASTFSKSQDASSNRSKSDRLLFENTYDTKPFRSIGKIFRKKSRNNLDLNNFSKNNFSEETTDEFTSIDADVEIEKSINNISYKNFLDENPMIGKLRIQSYIARKAYPLSNVKIIIFKNFSDGEKVFFSGVTDSNGIIDDIDLPAPSMLNSINVENVYRNSVFKLVAEINGYEKVEKQVEIFEGIKTVQPLLMTEIWEG